jgi:Ca-activated chloride channel homolog
MNLSEFSFGSPEAFYGILVLLLAFFLAYSRAASDRSLKARMSPSLFRNDPDHESPEYRLSSLSLLSLSLLFAVIALSMPRYGFEEIEQEARGADIVLAVDLSHSMNTEDVSPSRMVIMRRKVQDLLGILEGDRLALVTFAGVAFVESPLTLDYGVIRLFLESLSSDMMPVQGSDLEAAVRSAQTVFQNVKGSSRSRILLILSDGELDSSTLPQALHAMKESNIVPYLIAIGTEQGAPVPGPGGFKRDRDGKVVFSRSETEPLIPAFRNLGGDVLRFTGSLSDVKTVYRKIQENHSSASEETYITKKWNEYYQLPLLLSLLLLFITWTYKGSDKPSSVHMMFARALLKKKRKDPEAGDTASRSAALILLFLSSLALPLHARADAPRELTRALSTYHKGNFEEALEELDRLQESGHTSHHLHMARGNTLYRMGRFARAVSEYGAALEYGSNEKERTEALFNQGNALTQLGKYEYAISQYEKALEETPDDQETISNLAYVKKLLENQEDNKDEGDEKDDPQDDSESNQCDNPGEGGDSEGKDKGKDDSPDTKAHKEEGDKEQEGQQSDKKTQDPEATEDSDRKPFDGEDAEQPEDKDEEQDSGGSGKEDTMDEEDPSDRPEQEQQTRSADKEETEEQERAREQPQQSPDDTPQKQAEDASQSSMPQHELMDHLLDALEESTNARSRFRHRKAEEELKRMNRRPLEMDW